MGYEQEEIAHVPPGGSWPKIRVVTPPFNFRPFDAGLSMTFIQSVVAAIERPFVCEVFNLGESSTLSLRELVESIEEVSEKGEDSTDAVAAR